MKWIYIHTSLFTVMLLLQDESSVLDSRVCSPQLRFPLHSSTPEPLEGALSSDTLSLDSSASPDSDSLICPDVIEQSLDSQDLTELAFEEAEESMAEESMAEKSLNETTISIQSEAVETCTAVKSTNAGYKLVFDNIDKTIKPRYMRQDVQSVMLHYVQAYAVKDRIDFSSIGHEQRKEANIYKLIPESDDYRLLKNRFIIHVSRVIVEYLDFFKEDFKGLVQRHIPHKYSSEMCRISEIVSSIEGLMFIYNNVVISYDFESFLFVLCLSIALITLENTF